MKRSKHNLSHTHLTTADMGQLIPIGCVEVLPGDSVQHHTNVLVRVSPLAAPVMHPVTARVHHFFVPNRLTWTGWEDFITGGPDGNDASTVPTVSHDSTTNSYKLLDYLGVPPSNVGNDVNALPVRAYNAIYNEYYRDQDLVSAKNQDSTSVQNIAWEKDYFSSARPWTQKGSDVTIPLGESAPVLGIGKDTSVFSETSQTVRESDGTTSVYADSEYIDADADTDRHFQIREDPDNAGYPGIYADLANATGANINDVRRAFAIQRYQEARARYGSRYTEYLRYLGVRPKDERLQRPEYLGGGHAQISFSEVLQTGGETGQTPSNEYGVGDMYGHGISAMRSNKYRRFIEEHGYVMSLLSVRPKTIYQDGLQRHWGYVDKEDYFQKELQHIGQQAIRNEELYAPGDSTGKETFGYQDRYMHYRENPSRVSAEFRDTLDYWHMSRQFSSSPTLNDSFVTCTPTKRIHNVSTEDALWIMCQHKMVARRLVSRNAAPRIF